MIHFYFQILKTKSRLEAGSGNARMDLVEAWTFQAPFLWRDLVMEKKHKIDYRQAVVNFINGKCPPGNGLGGYYDPDVEDIEAHCENCDAPECFGSWIEELEGEPLSREDT